MVNQENTVEMANQYFSNQMDKVSVRRVEYNVKNIYLIDIETTVITIVLLL